MVPLVQVLQEVDDFLLEKFRELPIFHILGDEVNLPFLARPVLIHFLKNHTDPVDDVGPDPAGDELSKDLEAGFQRILDTA